MKNSLLDVMQELKILHDISLILGLYLTQCNAISFLNFFALRLCSDSPEQWWTWIVFVFHSSGAPAESCGRRSNPWKLSPTHHHHLRKIYFQIFLNLFSSSGGGNPDDYPDEQEMNWNYLWRQFFFVLLLHILGFIMFSYTCYLSLVEFTCNQTC